MGRTFRSGEGLRGVHYVNRDIILIHVESEVFPIKVVCYTYAIFSGA